MATRNASKNRTNKIVEKQKTQNFIQIFQMLDSDGDG